ncbi:hypothetical protein BDP27DRAFT_305148 [Rhodocollybia butyracea]|uniref:Uncharacterized protein n=1 Tax=Rhodocollybia butyracea TaxID=206335 RepID=A0A9P5U0R6_9AGAR|nr:hypothetical protein BDP27DRAFT_305148 [Rhodocollybia butyracea]
MPPSLTSNKNTQRSPTAIPRRTSQKRQKRQRLPACETRTGGDGCAGAEYFLGGTFEAVKRRPDLPAGGDTTEIPAPAPPGLMFGLVAPAFRAGGSGKEETRRRHEGKGFVHVRVHALVELESRRLISTLMLIGNALKFLFNTRVHVVLCSFVRSSVVCGRGTSYVREKGAFAPNLSWPLIRWTKDQRPSYCYYWH